jgi:hypothetical protein
VSGLMNHQSQRLNYNKRLQEKIEKGRKLVEELRAVGIKAELDEKTGEVIVKGSEFVKM